MSVSYGEVPPSTPAVAEAAAVPALRHLRVSWSALFAGAVLAVAVELLLAVLGAAVGLGHLMPKGGAAPNIRSFGIGAGVWWVVSMVISLLIGGYTAARLAGVSSRLDGMLQGLVIWGITLLLTMYLASAAVGGVFSAIGHTISTAGSAIGGTAEGAGSAVKVILPQIVRATGVTPHAFRQQAEAMLQQPAPTKPGSMSRADAVKAIATALPELLAGGSNAQAATQRISQIVAAQLHISLQQAKTRVSAALARLTAIKNHAVQAARRAARASAAAGSRMLYMAFVGMVIGAIGGGIGGGLAAPVSPWLPAEWMSRPRPRRA